jgi:hypothetical protein
LTLSYKLAKIIENLRERSIKMAKRNVIYVNPNKKKGGWDVKKQGAKRAQKHFETKDPAIQFGKKLAKGSGPGQLKVKKQNGRIQTEHTYGDDPYPPKG